MTSTSDRESRDMEKFNNKKHNNNNNHMNNNNNNNNNNNHNRRRNHQPHLSDTTSDSVYREISRLNGSFNRMDLSSMKNMCRDLNMDTRGRTDVVRRRLKEYFKYQKLESSGLYKNNNVDYFVVVDFEATCEERNPQGYPHEIIEFPAVLIDSKTKTIVDEFHSYIRPLINPTLSEFCRNLTGISQETVDASDPFLIVHEKFVQWLESHELGTVYTYSFVTDGPFDMGRFLFLQTGHSKLDYPNYGTVWVNLRKCFSYFYHTQKLPGLQNMLEHLGMNFQGSPHSGIDDARNIARIVVRMLIDRAHIRINEKIVLPEVGEDIGNPSPIHPGRLQSVVPVTRQEAEKWIQFQRKK